MPRRQHPSALRRNIVAPLLPIAVWLTLAPPAVALTTVRYVEVVGETAVVHRLREVDQGRMATVTRGTVLEVVDDDGDWYWVLLEPNDFGTRRVGWIAARDVEELPEPTPAPAARRGSQEGGTAVMAAMAAPQPGVAQESGPSDVIRLPEPLGLEIVVTFGFDSADLSDDARGQLDEMVGKMKTGAPGASIEIQGHTDSSGPSAYNLKLATARAEAVRRYLNEQHQISLDRMDVVSYGEDRPAAPNDTPDGRAQNRRVVVTL